MKVFQKFIALSLAQIIIKEFRVPGNFIINYLTKSNFDSKVINQLLKRMEPTKTVEAAPLTKQISAPTTKQGASGPMALHDVLDKIRLDVN